MWRYMPIQAALTKYHKLVAYKQQTYFSQFWGLGSPRSRQWQCWCLVRASFLDGHPDVITAYGGRGKGAFLDSVIRGLIPFRRVLP